MRVTYLGTASVLLDLGGRRLLTDPVFDPKGTQYDFGMWCTPRSWFASEKTYETPATPDSIGAIDAVLLSHDQHADNLDYEGRRFLTRDAVAKVITTQAGARRLSKRAPSERTSPGEGLGIGEKTIGMITGSSYSLAGTKIRSTPARHGPPGLPQVHEVSGFLLEKSGAPSIWISGDTVACDSLHGYATELGNRKRKIDVAIVHCGGVRFPDVPLLGNALFTFDSTQAVEICRLVQPRVIIPIHRSGWAHFRESEEAFRSAFDRAGLGDRVRWLELGASTEID